MRALSCRSKVDRVNMSIEVPDVEGRYHITPKDITLRPDLEKYSTKEICRRIRLLETTTPMKEPLVQKMQHNVMI